MNNIEKNLTAIHQQIERAAIDYHRPAGDITLLAVSKKNRPAIFASPTSLDKEISERIICRKPNRKFRIWLTWTSYGTLSARFNPTRQKRWQHHLTGCIASIVSRSRNASTIKDQRQCHHSIFAFRSTWILRLASPVLPFPM